MIYEAGSMNPKTKVLLAKDVKKVLQGYIALNPNEYTTQLLSEIARELRLEE